MRPLSEILVREACELVGFVVGVGLSVVLIKLADRHASRKTAKRLDDVAEAIHNERTTRERQAEAAMAGAVADAASADRGPGPRAA